MSRNTIHFASLMRSIYAIQNNGAVPADKLHIGTFEDGDLDDPLNFDRRVLWFKPPTRQKTTIKGSDGNLKDAEICRMEVRHSMPDKIKLNDKYSPRLLVQFPPAILYANTPRSDAEYEEGNESDEEQRTTLKRSLYFSYRANDTKLTRAHNRHREAAEPAFQIDTFIRQCFDLEEYLETAVAKCDYSGDYKVQIRDRDTKQMVWRIIFDKPFIANPEQDEDNLFNKCGVKAQIYAPELSKFPRTAANTIIRLDKDADRCGKGMITYASICDDSWIACPVISFTITGLTGGNKYLTKLVSNLMLFKKVKTQGNAICPVNDRQEYVFKMRQMVNNNNDNSSSDEESDQEQTDTVNRKVDSALKGLDN